MINDKSTFRGTEDNSFRSGTAMMETLLIIPLIITVLFAIFLITRGVTREQSANVMDRYEAWHRTSGLNDFLDATPGSGIAQGGGNSQLNHMFFNNKADGILLRDDNLNFFPADWQTAWVGSAETASRDSYVMRLYLDQQLRDVSVGSTADFEISFTQTKPDTYYRHRHTRLGNDWAFANSWAIPNTYRLAGFSAYTSDIQYREPYHGNLFGHTYSDNKFALMEIFYRDFDNFLKPYDEESDNPIADVIRNAYIHTPAYLGPTIRR